jgi:hypothetical protein
MIILYVNILNMSKNIRQFSFSSTFPLFTDKANNSTDTLITIEITPSYFVVK